MCRYAQSNPDNRNRTWFQTCDLNCDPIRLTVESANLPSVYLYFLFIFLSQCYILCLVLHITFHLTHCLFSYICIDFIEFSLTYYLIMFLTSWILIGSFLQPSIFYSYNRVYCFIITWSTFMNIVLPLRILCILFASLTTVVYFTCDKMQTS